MNSIDYQLWDVFTDEALAGNQLAVVPNGDQVAPEIMQRIANEFSLPETAFLLSPQNRDCDYRFRIFTPQLELPMAGHPTIGSTFALAHSNTLQPGTGQISIELGVGPTTVDLVWDGAVLESAWMAQKNPEFGPSCSDAEILGRVLALDSSNFPVSDAPAQIVSSGVPLLFVCLRSRAGVDRAVLNRQELGQLVVALGIEECPVYVFTLEAGDDGALTYSRMFAPVFGIEEDPATGGASGPLIGYVSKYYPASVSSPGPFLNRQGAKMGRPSKIYISGGSTGSKTNELRIGGRAIHIGDGTLYL